MISTLTDSHSWMSFLTPYRPASKLDSTVTYKFFPSLPYEHAFLKSVRRRGPTPLLLTYPRPISSFLAMARPRAAAQGSFRGGPRANPSPRTYQAENNFSCRRVQPKVRVGNQIL